MKHQKTILLVEDDAIIALSEMRQLKDYGYTVIVAHNGEKAIEKVKSDPNSIDLVLMDIDLGNGIDGTQAAGEILRDNDIPILFLSSHTEPEIVERTENLTSYGYVVKSAGITVLDASIKMAFKLYDARQKLMIHNKKIKAQKTELQCLENRYRRLFETAKDGILILDPENGCIVDVNPFLNEMLGFTKKQMLKKYIWDISPFKSVSYSRKLFEELKQNEYVRYHDLPLERQDGDLVFVEFVCNVYLVDGKKVMQCNIRDITERMEIEETLTADIARKEAIVSELQHRAKNSFVMITSLMSIKSLTIKSPEAKKVLQELTHRVKSISDLYTLLYETKSIYEVDLKIYCLKVISSMMFHHMDITSEIEDIKVSTKIASSVGMILVELLSNAIKHAFPGSGKGTIHVTLSEIDSRFELTVADNGVGLPVDFDFTKTKGMGLHLVDLMVSQLKGTIAFRSDQGTGITIKFHSSLTKDLFPDFERLQPAAHAY